MKYEVCSINVLVLCVNIHLDVISKCFQDLFHYHYRLLFSITVIAYMNSFCNLVTVSRKFSIFNCTISLTSICMGVDSRILSSLQFTVDLRRINSWFVNVAYQIFNWAIIVKMRVNFGSNIYGLKANVTQHVDSQFGIRIVFD